MKISARNQLQGKIKSVQPGSVMAEIVVELSGGQEIVSAITLGSAEALKLKSGDDVIVVIKSTEVMIAKD